MLLFSWQVIHAARTLAAHPVSKIAQENMEVFVDVWEAQVEELGKVLRLITAGGDPSKSKCARQCTLIYCFFFVMNYKYSRLCFWTYMYMTSFRLLWSPSVQCEVNLTCKTDSHSFRKSYLKESLCIIMHSQPFETSTLI